MPETPTKHFISEPIRPVTASMDTRAAVGGAPDLPRQFQWRDERLEVTEVKRAWRESGPCTHGSGETYAKKHWFEVTTTTGLSAQLYFERQARGKRLQRWWLYTITPAA